MQDAQEPQDAYRGGGYITYMTTGSPPRVDPSRPTLMTSFPVNVENDLHTPEVSALAARAVA